MRREHRAGQRESRDGTRNCQITHGFVDLLGSRNLSTNGGGSLKGFRSMSGKMRLDRLFLWRESLLPPLWRRQWAGHELTEIQGSRPPWPYKHSKMVVALMTLPMGRQRDDSLSFGGLTEQGRMAKEKSAKWRLCSWLGPLRRNECHSLTQDTRETVLRRWLWVCFNPVKAEVFMVPPVEMPSTQMGSGELEREVSLKSLEPLLTRELARCPVSWFWLTIGRLRASGLHHHKPSPVFQATGYVGSRWEKEQTSPSLVLFKEKNLLGYFLRERN